jgi:hypothetical protein
MIDNYVEFLIDKLYSPAAICQKLRMAYVADANEMYVLHEGRDDRHFYSGMLKRIRKKTNFKFLPCGNRDGVTKAYAYIHPLQQFSPTRIMYMVDWDYDEVFPTDRALPRDVFVTDYYSIESYFIGRPCVEAVLRNVVGIPPEGGFLERLLDEIERTITDFADSMRAISACILAYRAKGKKIEQGKISVHTCFSFRGNCAVRRVSGSRAIVLRDVGLRVSFEEVRKWFKVLLLNDRRYWVRGKLFVWLLRNLFSRAAEAARLFIDPERKQYNFSTAPLQGHGIYLFAGQYAQIPQSLIRYVRRIRARPRKER